MCHEQQRVSFTTSVLQSIRNDIMKKTAMYINTFLLSAILKYLPAHDLQS